MTLSTAPALWARITKEDEKTVKRIAEETIGQVLGNFIATQTGQVKHGERIPVPVYQDGTAAAREECHYFVSPHEITTAMVFSRTLPSQGVVQQEIVREKIVTDQGQVIKKKPVRMDIFKLTQPIRATFHGAVYYIKSHVDQDGFARISLWKHGWEGQDFNVSDDRSYEDVQNYYNELGIRSSLEGTGMAQETIMKKIRETASVNYLVVAIRSVGK